MPNKGVTTVNFGSGKDLATTVITSETGILSGSNVDAWIIPATTSDHSIDEHIIEAIEVMAGNIVAGIGFTIYAQTRNTALRGQFSIGWAWA